MSKTKIDLLKSKFESKDKILFKEKENKKELYLIPNNGKEEESKQNDLNISSNTLKDSLSLLEEFKNSFYKNLNIKKIETNYYKNNPNINLFKLNNLSSFCKKGTISSDNRNSKFDLYHEDKIITDNKKIKNNLHNTICRKNGKKEIYQYHENKIINYLFNKINIEQIKKLKSIYEQTIKIFNDIKNISKKEEKENSNNNKNNNKHNNITLDIYNSKILSFQYIKAFLSTNFEIFTKIFYNSIEINKFILYQIYLFLSLIYLKEETINEYIFLSYKTILLYSSKNFDNILKIISDFKLFNDEKINKNIILLNKIILSILKTLSDIPSNQQILFFITPLKNTIENNDIENLGIEDIIEKRISGINNLLILLKENKDLNEKMKQIQKNEDILINTNDVIDKYEVEEVLPNKNEIELKNSESELILPDININKYKYSVILELDETLVHYCEENDNYFVKVRFGCESFINYINNFSEVIIVSTSEIEYSEIIIDNLNKNNCLINYRIISEKYKDLDLSKINRDIKKTFFICHKENFLNAPKSNIIQLKEFNGEEEDKIFVKLYEEFKKIEVNKIDDIRNIIPLIQKNISDEIIE